MKSSSYARISYIANKPIIQLWWKGRGFIDEFDIKKAKGAEEFFLMMQEMLEGEIDDLLAMRGMSLT